MTASIDSIVSLRRLKVQFGFHAGQFGEMAAESGFEGRCAVDGNR